MSANAPKSRICPFCRGAVPEDVVLHGGNCPHCMLEIPGEEAPTDPGAILRQKQALDAREGERRNARMRRVYAALAVVMLCLVAAAVGKWFRLRAEAVTYELPDEYYQPTPLELSVPVVAATGSTARPAGGAGARSTGGGVANAGASGGGGSAGTASGAITAVGAVPRATAGRSEDAAPPSVSVSSTGGGLPSLSVDVGGGFGGVLSGDDEILAMVKGAASKYKPQLDTCYRQRLNGAPDLRGSWSVSFTITPPGATVKVAVEPVGSGDRELESCIARAVASWKFQRIDHEFNVRKKYTFAPAF